MGNRLAVLPLLGLLLLLAVAWIVYAPGIHGSFLFDDFGNLPALGATGPVDSWPAFWRYITSGTADPTGRPLTLLTFLMDARDWPADPYPFKRTNLILHLLNGVLLTALLRRLGLNAFGLAVQRRIEIAAVLGAAFWMLHPLLVSTTLYIVQREAMLPATFTLLGLLLWQRGRHALQRGHIARSLLWIALGLGGCTMLGVLSKANGILLPALALVIEYGLLPRVFGQGSTAGDHTSIQAGLPGVAPEGSSIATEVAPTTKESPRGAGVRQCRAYGWAMAVFGWLPATMAAGYLLNSAWDGFAHGLSTLRPWTMGQRLLTEPRVLMDYLDLLWLPRPFTPGLFNDQIKASLSLWSPASTLPALLAVLGLIIGAWLLRRRWPAFALAILFYFVGQSLESSTIPLELYYEHRNYLPAMLMFWPLALWLCGVRQDELAATRDGPGTSEKHRARGALLQQPECNHVGRSDLRGTNWAKGMLAAVLLLGMAMMTHARAQLWGNTRDQGGLWATLNPDSPRAQANAALLEMAAGQPWHAIVRLETLLRAQPDQVQLAFNLIGARCMLGALGPNDLAQAHYAIANARDPGGLLVHWFEGSIPTAVSGRCRGLDLNALDSLLDAGLANSKLMDVYGRHQDLLYLKGRIALARHDPTTTLHDFNAALDQDVRPGAALEQAAMLGSAGYPREGLAHLEHYELVQHLQVSPGFGMPWLHAWVLRYQDYWSTEIAHLRDTLQQDAQTKVASYK
jgi:protein O-mannosyl-transferase